MVHYGQNRYQVPKGTYFPGREARIELDDPKTNIRFYDTKTGELLAEHAVAAGIGQLVRIPRNAERFKFTRYLTLERDLLTQLTELNQAERYIKMLVDKYPRYAGDQLRIIRQCTQAYSMDELSRAFNYCIERDLISANDFRDTLVFFRQDEPKLTPNSVSLPEKYQAVRPKVRSLSVYSRSLEAGTGGGTL